MKRAWATFWLLGIIWGSSFMLIRVAALEVNFVEVVLVRVGIAALGLNLLLLARGQRLPLTRDTIMPMVLVGLGNTAIPFMLITWGERTVESSVASILQASASLFTLIIAHFIFADERMTPQRVAGIVVGFFGIVVLFSGGGLNAGGTLPGMGAIVLASAFYGFATVYSRAAIQKKIAPLAMAAGSMVTATIFTVILLLLLPLFNGPAIGTVFDASPAALWSMLVLGVVNTCIAYALFYNIVDVLGAARAAMVTYIVPPVGAVLGVVFLREPLTWQLVVGATLILGGIAVVSLRRRRKAVAPTPASPAVAS